MTLYKNRRFRKIYGIATYKLSIKALLAVILLFFGAVEIMGQTYADSKGKDFWLTFMPNYHNNINSKEIRRQRGDSLYIFLTAEKPTQARIDYYDKFGGSYSDTINIVNTTQVYTFKLSFNEFELSGYNESGNETQYFQNDAEKVSYLSFHITSDEDINVYAHNQAVTTSEAMMVFPVDALGYDYFVMSYNSNDTYDNNPFSLQSTPSQFVIVATEDNTRVTIKPSCPTQYNGRNNRVIDLNKGEVYLVQALITFENKNYDLTGTEIDATKPVAVFGGQQRTRIPVDMIGSSPSRDYIIEQLPPVSTWGKRAFLTTYPQLPDMTNETSDIYRILAANDDTEVYFNDKYVTTLGSGDFYENELTSPGIVFATGPVLIAQYKRTSQAYGGTTEFLPPGDPFMMVIPPKEQFMKFYRVINTQAWELTGFDDDTIGIPEYIYDKVYEYQYITVTAPDTAIQSVEIDGKKVQGIFFSPIPGSGYSFANIRVTDGVHTVEADEPIGIYVYGYGGANSYGYVGGMSFVPFDYKKPLLSVNIDCFELNGNIYDSLQYDTGITEFRELFDSNRNVEVVISNFKQLQSKIDYRAKLINNRHDGKFTLYSVDGYKNKAIYNIDIPGFTIGVEGSEPKEAVRSYSYGTRIEKEFCFDIPLVNYGKFNQLISDIRFKNNTFLFKEPPFKELAPQKDTIIAACAIFSTEGIYTDTLVIENKCGTWDIAVITIDARKDSHNPEVHLFADPCNREFSVSITDSLPNDFGLYTVKYNELVNCTVGNIMQDEKTHLSKLSVTDPFYDAIYDITVEDGFGLVTNIRDTIQGFTISITFGNETNRLDFGNSNIGARYCDSVRLFNYGLLPLVLNDAYVYGNILFSVPQGQFPVIIEPGSEKYLDVCLRALTFTSDLIDDSLRLDFNCVSITAPFAGVAGYLENKATTRCNLPIRIITNSVPEAFFIEQNIPNPVLNSETKIVFGLAGESNVRLSISDLAGRNIEQFDFGYYYGGVYEINLNTAGIPSGVYLYVMEACNRKIARVFVVDY